MGGRAGEKRSGSNCIRRLPERSSTTSASGSNELLRELEKLALELGDGARIGLEQIEEMTANSSERKSWTLADALVARDGASATRAYLELRQQGERLAGLLFTIARRLRDALEVAERLEAGESAASVKRGLRMPPKAAERFVADVQRNDVAGLRARDRDRRRPGTRLAWRRRLQARRGHARGQSDRPHRRLRSAAERRKTRLRGPIGVLLDMSS